MAQETTTTITTTTVATANRNTNTNGDGQDELGDEMGNTESTNADNDAARLRDRMQQTHDEYEERLRSMKHHLEDWKGKNPLKHVSLYYEEFTLPDTACHYDLWFKVYCIEKYHNDPYTGIEYGSNGEPIPNPKKNVSKKKSKAYDEFVDLVSRKKDWIANKRMMKQKDDNTLARFMNKYEFESGQVQSKIRTILKSYNIADI